MNDLSIATARTPLLERQSELGAQSIPEVEERTQSAFQRVCSAIAWFFSMLNPFSCCMPSAQADEGNDQANLMERGELAQRVSLPPPRVGLEEPQVREKQYEIIDLGNGNSLKLEIRPPVQREGRIEVQRKERVVAKPVDFPVERGQIRRLEGVVEKLESRLTQIDRELSNPRLTKTSTYGISKILAASELDRESTMDDLLAVLDKNRRIDDLTSQRPAVQRELDIARDDLQSTITLFNLPEAS